MPISRCPRWRVIASDLLTAAPQRSGGRVERAPRSPFISVHFGEETGRLYQPTGRRTGNPLRAVGTRLRCSGRQGVDKDKDVGSQGTAMRAAVRCVGGRRGRLSGGPPRV